MHDRFRGMQCSDFSQIRSFLEDHPLYAEATTYLCDYIHELTKTFAGMNQEVKCIMHRFLSMPVHEAFLLWDRCSIVRSLMKILPAECWPQVSEINDYLSPLHFASLLGLVDQVQRLCRDGLDPNCYSLPMEDNHSHAYTSLHLALLNNADESSVCGSYLAFEQIMWSITADLVFDEICVEAKLQTIKTLVQAGASVHQQLIIHLDFAAGAPGVASPLSLAFLSGF